jgi:hypothetical protein
MKVLPEEMGRFHGFYFFNEKLCLKYLNIFLNLPSAYYFQGLIMDSKTFAVALPTKLGMLAGEVRRR